MEEFEEKCSGLAVCGRNWQRRFIELVDIDTYSVQIGEIVYEINVIDLSVETRIPD